MPTVASAVGVHCEQVVDGETGVLVRDAPDFESAMIDLHSDPKRAAEMGRAARERVCKLWSFERWFPAWKAFLLDVATGDGKRVEDGAAH